MIEFAGRFDPQPFHLDDEAARGTLFGGLAASGWHTAGITMRLQVTSGPPIAGGLVGAGGQIDWPRPTRAGDTLRVESEVLEVQALAEPPGPGDRDDAEQHPEPGRRDRADVHGEHGGAAPPLRRA